MDRGGRFRGRRPVLLLDGRRRRQGRLDDVRRQRHDLSPTHAATTAAGAPPYYRRPATRGGPRADLRNRRAPLPPQPAAPATACCGGCDLYRRRGQGRPSRGGRRRRRRPRQSFGDATAPTRAARAGFGRIQARGPPRQSSAQPIKAPSKNPCSDAPKSKRASSSDISSGTLEAPNKTPPH